MNNVVFQVNIKGHRVKPEFEYSTKSWAKWCEKNKFQHFVLTEPINDLKYMNANWHKFYILEMLENENIDYDQVCIVDADTIVHPNCPNFFKETDNKFSVVQSDGCYEWVNRSISSYSRFIFEDIEIQPWNYFNSGFMVVNKSHKDFCNKVYDFYYENRDKIVSAQEQLKVGTDQTPINFLTKKFNIDLKFLPNCYNLQDMFRKTLLHIPSLHTNTVLQDSLDYVFKSGWVYHFNSVPSIAKDRDVGYWMKRTYEELYEKD